MSELFICYLSLKTTAVNAALFLINHIHFYADICYLNFFFFIDYCF